MEVMCDIETLDVLPTAVVLSIALVKFNNVPISVDNANVLVLYPDVDQQVAHGRTISEETVQFWANQPPEIQERQFSDKGRISVTQCLSQVHNFVWGCDRIWSNRFMDLNIMQHMFLTNDMFVPWKFWQASDCSSLFFEFNMKTKHADKHDPVADCIEQIRMVQVIRQKIRSLL